MNPYHEPWTEHATCRSIGSDAFYPESGTPHVDWNYLRSVCLTRCKVRLQCLDYAMCSELGQDHKTRFGVWAGMSPLERKKYEPQWLAEQESAA